MLDQQTRQQLQTKFQQIKPQLKGQFSGLTDQDLDVGQRDPDTLIDTISRKTGQGRIRSRRPFASWSAPTRHTPCTARRASPPGGTLRAFRVSGTARLA